MVTRVLCGLAAALLCLFIASAEAQTWDGGGAPGGSVTWNTGLNWNPDGLPANNGTANIIMAGTIDTTNTVDVNFDINSLTFANNGVGAPFVINASGGATLQIRTGGILNNDPDTQTINVPIIHTFGPTINWNAGAGDIVIGGTVTLNNAAAILQVFGNNDVIVNGPISGAVNVFVKSGNGELQLNAANTFTSNFNLSAGTLSIGNSSALGSSTLTLNAGTIQAIGGQRTITNAVTLNGNFSVSGSNDMDFSGAATLTGDRTITVSNGVTTFSGAIGENAAGRSFTKAGTGTLTFGGNLANTYSGNTTVNAGMLLLIKTGGGNAIAGGEVTVGDGAGGANSDTLRYGASNQIADSANITVRSSGLFDLNGGSDTINNLTFDGGNVTTVGGTLTVNGSVSVLAAMGSATFTGNLNFAGGTRSFDVADGGATTDLDVVGTIANGGITKIGAGLLQFSGTGANSYLGTTIVNDGTLTLNKSAVNGTILGDLIIGDGIGTDAVNVVTQNQIANTANVTLSRGGVLTLTAAEDGFGLLTFNAGTVSIPVGSSLTLTNDVVVNPSGFTAYISGAASSPLILSGARTFTVADGTVGSDFYISEVVQGGTLVKEGLGLMAIAGTVSNTAAFTINAGWLLADKTGAAAMTGNVTVGDGVGGVDADILQIQQAEQIDQTASDTLTINSSGLFSLNGFTETIGNLLLNGGHVGAGILIPSGSVTVNANAQTATINSTVNLSGGSRNFNVADGLATVDLNVTGTITNGTLIKVGAGTMQLTTTADNTATINVNEGTLLLANSSGSAMQGILAIGDGFSPQSSDIARLMANDQLADNAISVAVQSSGLLDLNGFSDTVGPLYMTAGVITTGAGTLSLANSLETYSHPLTGSISGNVYLGTAPRTFTINDGVATIDLDVSATITAGVGGQLIKAGAGTMQLSGTQNVPIVLNAGTLAAAFTIGPTGSLTQNAGTLSGTLTNQGTFTYNGGTFSGQLINEGATSLGANFVAGNGVINFGTFTFGAGQSLTTNGAGLNNQGTITLTGGTIGGNGPLVNNSVLSGRGTIGGSAGFANNGTLSITGGNLSLTNSGANTNAGLITVPFGLQLRLLGGNLTNTGIIDLDGGSISGTATLVNAAGGTVEGGSSVQTPMTNNGGLIHANAGTTFLITDLSGGNVNGGELRIENSSGINVTSAFASSGTIVLLGADAQLIGGAVTNTGTIRGRGRVSNSVLNSGTVLAEGGRLTLSGSGHTNTAAGIIEAQAAAEIFYSQGLATNAGQIALVGGTFDNNNRTLANTGSVAGDGVIRTGGLTNTGSIGVGGGDLDLVGPVTNNSTISIQSGSTARFFGPVNGPGNYPGTGTAMFLNSFSPGASPAQVSFGGDLVFGGAASLTVELAGTTPGKQFDRLVVAGSASLAGALNVVLLDGFTPAVRNSFEVIHADAGIFGAFSATALPELSSGLLWNIVYTNFSVILQVAPLLPGDYNFNGVVDAADYVVWRKTLGSTTNLAADGNGNNQVDPGDYNVWRAHFGQTAGSGSATATPSQSAVPEPAGLVLAIFALLSVAVSNRRHAAIGTRVT